MTHRATTIAIAIAAGATLAPAQSLFLADSPVILDESGTPDPLADLRSASLFIVEPPEPPSFEVHDIIYLIIDENTNARSSQSIETSSEFDASGQLRAVLDPMELLELRLQPGLINNTSLLDLTADKEFTGEGDYNRQDRIQARIAATVLDVKPNGTLVLEARKSVVTDEEERTIVLTGSARKEDITRQNTILSSQLADLNMSMQHTGELKNASKKGIFTRIIEALFAF